MSYVIHYLYQQRQEETGLNWENLFEFTDKQKPFFSKKYVDELKGEIKSGKNGALKSRRNKKYVSGNFLYNSYVSDKCKSIDALQKLLVMANEASIDFSLETIQYFVADCALHLLAQKYDYAFKNEKLLLAKYLRGEVSLEAYTELIDSLIISYEEAISFCESNPLLFRLDYVYEPDEDILGLIYISCKNIGNRKATGSYYTPTRVVKKLIAKLEISADDKILDPCCGTEIFYCNFLVQFRSIRCMGMILIRLV